MKSYVLSQSLTKDRTTASACTYARAGAVRCTAPLLPSIWQEKQRQRDFVSTSRQAGGEIRAAVSCYICFLLPVNSLWLIVLFLMVNDRSSGVVKSWMVLIIPDLVWSQEVSKTLKIWKIFENWKFFVNWKSFRMIFTNYWYFMGEMTENKD